MADNTTGTEQSTGTIREAASAFEQFLTSKEEGNQDVEAKPKADEESDEDAEAEEGTTSDETTDEEVEEGEQSEEDADDEQTPQDQLFTVRVDGTEEKVQLSELLAGYSRTKDYTQKTQALATQRKALEQEAGQTRQLRADYAELLPKLRAALGAGEVEPNWEELRAADPVRAVLEKQRFEERKTKVAAVLAEEARIKGEADKENAALREQILADEQRKMLLRPELAHWADEAKATADAALIVKTLKNAGYADEELQIFDHRAMVIALKAAKYDQLTRQRTAAQKTVRGKVEVAQVSKPGTGTRQAPNAVKSDRNRLVKSGSVKDAARLFEHLFD